MVAHIQNTNTQYNLPAFTKKISRKYNHKGVAERFDNPEVQKSVEVDLALIDSLNEILKKLEWHIEKTAREHDYHRLSCAPVLVIDLRTVFRRNRAHCLPPFLSTGVVDLSCPSNESVEIVLLQKITCSTIAVTLQ